MSKRYDSIITGNKERSHIGMDRTEYNTIVLSSLETLLYQIAVYELCVFWCDPSITFPTP